MPQTVTATSPRPSASPTLRATGPLTTSPTSTSATTRTLTSVTTSVTGRSFQNGRPSSIS